MGKPGKRILIVDDEPRVVGMLAEHLQAQYAVESASNGADALAAVLRHRPDAVLLDIRMPGMDGIEVLKQIRRIDPTIRVIMITGNDELAVAVEATKAGAFAYVRKPFNLEYIDTLVATAVR